MKIVWSKYEHLGPIIIYMSIGIYPKPKDYKSIFLKNIESNVGEVTILTRDHPEFIRPYFVSDFLTVPTYEEFVEKDKKYGDLINTIVWFYTEIIDKVSLDVGKRFVRHLRRYSKESSFPIYKII